MRQVGLNVSSNFNPCYFGKCCKMRLDDAPLGLFATPEPEVWELPITNFLEPRGGHRDVRGAAAQELAEGLDVLQPDAHLQGVHVHPAASHHHHVEGVCHGSPSPASSVALRRHCAPQHSTL